MTSKAPPDRRCYLARTEYDAHTFRDRFDKLGMNPEVVAPVTPGGTNPTDAAYHVYYDGLPQLPEVYGQPTTEASCHYGRPEYFRFYGGSFKTTPDFARCAVAIRDNYTSGQCQHRAKHDPDHTGKPTRCGHHSRAAYARRDAAAEAKTKERMAYYKKRNDQNALMRSAVALVRKIAAGHNDPRGAALDLLSQYEPPEEK